MDKITLTYRSTTYSQLLNIMLLLYHVIAGVLFLNVFCSNTKTHQRIYQMRSGNDVHNKVIETIKTLLNERQDGRKFDSAEYKRKYLLDTLKMHISESDYNKLLRQQVDESITVPIIEDKDKLTDLVESELKYAFAKKSSALFDRPYVQKKGKQDFLVIHPGNLDPFVTVIPNDIFYNHEKKCINWLEDCNLQGIRSRLLQKVRSPYV